MGRAVYEDGSLVDDDDDLRLWCQEDLDKEVAKVQLSRLQDREEKFTPQRDDYIMGEQRKTQVGGDHYTKLTIQPLEYALKNNLGVMEHAVVKYVSRHESKGGAEDIRKAIDYLHKILEFKYGETK